MASFSKKRLHSQKLLVLNQTNSSIRQSNYLIKAKFTSTFLIFLSFLVNISLNSYKLSILLLFVLLLLVIVLDLFSFSLLLFVICILTSFLTNCWKMWSLRCLVVPLFKLFCCCKCTHLPSHCFLIAVKVRFWILFYLKLWLKTILWCHCARFEVLCHWWIVLKDKP